MSAVLDTLWSLWAVLVIASEACALMLTPRVLLADKSPGSTIAWLFSVWLLPVVGPGLFLLVGRDRLERGLPRKKRRAAAASGGALARTRRERGEHAVDPSTLDETSAQLARVAERLGEATLTGGNRVELLSSAGVFYDRLLDDMAAAERQIHLEFYIWRDDAVGTRLARRLAQRAQDGLEVRLLLDAAGCYEMSGQAVGRLREAGVEVAFFHPMNPLRRRFNVNLRNHRKIALIDGQVGYTGGINVGDEYLGLSDELGPWRDTAVRIAGPAARALQRVFCEDWHFTTGALLARPEDFPDITPVGEAPVQVVASGPDEDFGKIHQLYFTALALARRSVLITTPYFVPDEAVEMALESAALRGVDVRIVMPRRSDNRVADAAARAYVARMLASGVRFYLYEHGFVHAKTLVVDGRFGAVGSANLDVRSFRLNFEAGAIIYEPAFAAALAADFHRDVARSTEVTLADARAQSTLHRTWDALCRLASPVL